MADPTGSKPTGSQPTGSGATGGRDPLDHAVGLLGAPRSGTPAQAPRHPDATTDAMSVIGAAIGRPMRPPAAGGRADPDPVAATVTASGWLTWPVRLHRGWRDAVVVPLLARLEGQPVAVLPEPGGPVVVGGGDRSMVRLTRRDAVAMADEMADEMAGAMADGAAGELALAVAVDLPDTGSWLDLVRWSLRRQRSDVRRFAVLAAITGLATLLLPLATGALFESAIPAGDLGRAGLILGGFAIASAGAVLVTFALGLTVVRVRDRTDAILAAGSMARLLRLPAGFFRSRSTGDVVNRVTSAEAARAQVDDSVIVMVVSSVVGLISLGYLLAAGAVIGLVTIAAVLGVLTASVAIQWRARRRLPALLEGRSRSDAMLLSILDNLVSWRVTAGESRALARWAALQQVSTGAMRDRLSAVSVGESFKSAGAVLVLAAFTAVVVVAPGDSLQPGSASAPGTFLAMYAAVLQVTIALLTFSDHLLTLSELGPVLRRLDPIRLAVEERPPAPDRAGAGGDGSNGEGTGGDGASGGRAAAEDPGVLVGGVRLVEVTFGYRRDRPPLLERLSLDVAPGEFLAVVGPSGSGKSTLLRLLMGFEIPWQGMVEYDGRDLAHLDPVAVRRQLGVVLQSSQPLGRTVRETVTAGRHMADGELIDLLERAGLGDDLATGTMTPDLPIGRHGTGLSGGQRQRLMLAAALAGDPSVLLLDEATSALDNVTQAAVMRTLESAASTRIVIAHRLSTVTRADRVVVIADGAVAESGSPADLLQAGGRFATLAARQEL